METGVARNPPVVLLLVVLLTLARVVVDCSDGLLELANAVSLCDDLLGCRIGAIVQAEECSEGILAVCRVVLRARRAFENVEGAVGGGAID